MVQLTILSFTLQQHYFLLFALKLNFGIFFDLSDPFSGPSAPTDQFFLLLGNGFFIEFLFFLLKLFLIVLNGDNIDIVHQLIVFIFEGGPVFFLQALALVMLF
jgi:hypothetical protein